MAELDDILASGDLTSPFASSVSTGIVQTHTPTVANSVMGWSFSHSLGEFSNGPVGQTTYYDDTWKFGFNIDQNGTQVVNTEPSLFIQFESKYYQGDGNDDPQFLTEYHLNHRTTDGTLHRPMAHVAPHTGTAGGAWQWSADRFIFTGQNGSELFTVSKEHTQMSLIGVSLARTVNNVNFIRQTNAAGTGLVSLLKLNASDVAEIGAPLNVVAPRSSTAVFARFQPTSANNGDTLFQVLAPTTASVALTALNVGGAITWDISALLYNSNTASNLAHAFQRIRTGGAAGGDPYIEWLINGVQAYVAGIDNSDSDKWVLSVGAALGTNNAIIVDTAKAVTLTGAVNMTALPTSNPAVAGALWNDAGTLKVSAG